MYHDLRPEGYQPPDSTHLSSGWYDQASQQMATAAKNGTSTNFYRCFTRYLKHKYNFDGPKAYQTLKDIHADHYDGQDELILHYRSLLPAKPQHGGKREDYPELVLPLLYLFLEHFEKAQQITRGDDDYISKKVRLFSLLPMKNGFECSHLKICNTGLYGLLKRSNIEGIPSNAPTFRTMADTYWRHFFNIEKYETKNRKFAGEIVTDGKAVSIILRKPRSETTVNDDRELELQDFDEIWGLDPGRCQLFVASNEQGEIKKFSTKQFYHEAGFKASCKKIETWQNNDEQVKEAISKMPCTKTTSVDRFKLYIEYLLPHLDMLLNFHIKKGYRDLKFTEEKRSFVKCVKI